MTNNRQNQSLNLNAATASTASALQRRSFVPPVIEFVGKNQTLSAAATTLIEWNEVLRQTDQPLSTWRGNNTANYVWPVFVSPGTGSLAYQIQFNVSGYHLSLSTVLLTATTGTLTFLFKDSVGTILQTTAQTFPSQVQQVHTMLTYVESGWILECYIASPVANTLLTSGQYRSLGPSPRLIIAQVAQFEDSPIAKMTRGVSSSTIVTTTATPTLLSSLTIPPAAATNLADGYTYNAGGSNQLNAFVGTAGNQVAVTERGVYLLTGQITFQNDPTNVGTRTIMLVANGASVFASQSVAATVNAGRWLNISAIYPLIAGDYVQVYGLQNSGGNVNMATFGVRHSLSITMLTAY
jgi:hypothetical protein